MPKTIDPVIAARSVLGNATRSGDPERIARARMNLRAAMLERAILAERDAITDDQRATLAQLLLTGGDN